MKISPPNWYVGMRNSIVQLLVSDKGVGRGNVSVSPNNAKLERVVRLDNPDYLALYINIENASPGQIMVNIDGTGYAYELKQREKRGEERQGFSAADVLYLLLPDRFARGRRGNIKPKDLNPYTLNRKRPNLRHGGDLEGIRQHLDYLRQLGVTTLWLTPIQENNSPDREGNSTYHGYAITNYYRVDPRLGTLDDYRQLADAAHEKGLKIVMDMVFNHCGIDHPWVANPPTADWFNAPEWLEEWRASGSNDIKPGPKYRQTNYKLTPLVDPYASEADRRQTVEGWFVPTMPDLNQRNPLLMDYLAQTSLWWMETIGLDGIRMDTYPYADREAMAGWMEAFAKEYPNVNVVGETWVAEPAFTAAWQKDSRLAPGNSHLPVVMDFSFFDKINQAKHEETDDWGEGMNRVYNNFVYDYLYAEPRNVLAFIDNHDTDRFLGETKDAAALKQALAILLTTNRTPQIYYGTEIMMNGTKADGDGAVRRDFPGGFPGDRRNAFTPQGRTRAENDMFDWLSRLLAWRKTSLAVAEGAMTQFIPAQGVYVFARLHPDAPTIITIANGTSSPRQLPLERYKEVLADAKTATDILTGNAYSLTTPIPLAPRQTLILELPKA